MGLRRGERLAALVRHCLSASLTSLIPSVNLSERFDFAFFVLPASGGALVVNRKLMNHPEEFVDDWLGSRRLRG